MEEGTQRDQVRKRVGDTLMQFKHFISETRCVLARHEHAQKRAWVFTPPLWKQALHAVVVDASRARIFDKNTSLPFFFVVFVILIEMI
jgi:hypothetical protein